MLALAITFGDTIMISAELPGKPAILQGGAGRFSGYGSGVEMVLWRDGWITLRCME